MPKYYKYSKNGMVESIHGNYVGLTAYSEMRKQRDSATNKTESLERRLEQSRTQLTEQQERTAREEAALEECRNETIDECTRLLSVAACEHASPWTLLFELKRQQPHRMTISILNPATKPPTTIGVCQSCRQIWPCETESLKPAKTDDEPKEKSDG